MAVRVLADGKIKFTILTTAPVNPAAPTAAELNAGIDASCKVAMADFRWTPTNSDSVDDAALCTSSNAKARGRGNAECAFTVYRWFTTAGAIDTAADTVFAAAKTAGTNLYGYVRKDSSKPATAAWAADDEIHMGALVETDHPQTRSGGSYIGDHIPCFVQDFWPQIKVAAA